MLVIISVNGKIIPEDEICNIQLSNEGLRSIFQAVKQRMEAQWEKEEKEAHNSAIKTGSESPMDYTTPKDQT